MYKSIFFLYGIYFKPVALSKLFSALGPDFFRNKFYELVKFYGCGLFLAVQTIGNLAGFRLVLSDYHNVRNLLNLRLSHLITEFLGSVVDVYTNICIKECIIYLRSICIQFLIVIFIGSTFTCTGASQVGRFPLVSSRMYAMNLSMDPKIARCKTTGVFLLPSTSM